MSKKQEQEKPLHDGKMKIELKKFTHNDRLSEETDCFAADLYIDGVRAGYASNRGYGGDTSIQVCEPYAESRALIAKAEKWAKSQPKHKSVEFNFEYNVDLEYIVDDLVTQILIEKDKVKFAEKLAKDMANGLCYGTGTAYSMMVWKGFTIEKLLQSQQGVLVLTKGIKTLKAKGTGKILNTNIPAPIINA